MAGCVSFVFHVFAKMLPYEPVPIFNGGSSPFADYRQEVRLWAQSVEVEPSKRASTLSLQVDSLLQAEDVETGLNVLRDYSPPDEFDHVYRLATKFLQCNCADLIMGRSLLEFQPLRCEAAARAPDGRCAPGWFCLDIAHAKRGSSAE